MAVEFSLGRREQIGIGEETDYGTAVSPVFVLARDATFDPNKDDQGWVEIRGAGADAITVTHELGIKTVGGVLSFAPQDWRWLKFVTGDGSDDVGDVDSGAYYTHTFTNAVDIASFTLERAIRHTTANDHVLTYEGCQVASAGISWDAGGGAAGGSLMRVSLDVVGEDVNPGTSTTSLSAPTTAAFQFRNVLLTLAGSAATNLKGGTMNIENNLNDARYAYYTAANSRFKGESGPQVRRFNGTFRIKQKDDTYFDLWDTEAVQASTNTLVFERGTNDNLTCTFSNLYITKPADPTNLDGFNEVTLDWVADNVTFVAKDQIAAY
jgi:hypothetical protein